MVRYGFVGRMDSQSILMAVNLFIIVHFMYYTRKSFTQCLLNELNSSQHSKKKTEFASVLRRQAILKICIVFEVSVSMFVHGYQSG